MQLSPQERDRLLLFSAAELARRRRAAGLRLNVPESVALVADTAAEVARAGGRLADAVAAGRAVLGPGDLLPGVAEVVTEVRVEAVFDDGTRLVVIGAPFGSGTPAGPGAVLAAVRAPEPAADLLTVPVTNTAAVPVSVTSHFHFFEVNRRLRFDRSAAYGRRLAVPAGAVVRFAPGATVPVELTPIGGARVIVGYAGLVDGPLDAPGARAAALARAAAAGYLGAAPP